MDDLEWAEWGLKYLKDGRRSIHDEFNDLMNELREYQRTARNERWYGKCKDIIPILYHFSEEFSAQTTIPNSEITSPQDFAEKLKSYRDFVAVMANELAQEASAYQETHKVDGPPFLVSSSQRLVSYCSGLIDYVDQNRPSQTSESPNVADLALVRSLCKRFHESVLSLTKHPHGGPTFTVNNEWDCQYLFRSILASYFDDIRDEEWNPSVAGSSARCEFFLKTLRIMIELKYVRKPDDNKKIKGELATDLMDYGANPLVDHVICLVYDPSCKLKNAVGLEKDLSGETKGLSSVDVIVSPPRST